MMNLYIYCEGQTEESFIRYVLQERLAEKNIFVTPIIAATKRTGLRKYSGGTILYSKLKSEIKNLCANRAFYTTTMFDYYALPQDVPGRKNPVGDTIPKLGNIYLLCRRFAGETFVESARRRHMFPAFSIYTRRYRMWKMNGKRMLANRILLRI